MKKSEKMNRKLSLNPLSFKEAVSDILKVKPEPKEKATVRRKKKK